MSNSFDEDTFAASYVEASGISHAGRYSLRLGELALVLNSALEWSSIRLKFLTALQGALALPRDEEQLPSSQGALVGDLKEALTNVIIMQTRLNERDKDLVGQLEGAQRDGLLEPVEVDSEDVRRWAESVARAYHHLEHRGSKAEE